MRSRSVSALPVASTDAPVGAQECVVVGFQQHAGAAPGGENGAADGPAALGDDVRRGLWREVDGRCGDSVVFAVRFDQDVLRIADEDAQSCIAALALDVVEADA